MPRPIVTAVSLLCVLVPPVAAAAQERLGFATDVRAAVAADGRVHVTGLRVSRSGARTDAVSWTARPGEDFGAPRVHARARRPERITAVALAADGTGAVVSLRRGRARLFPAGRAGAATTLSRTATSAPALAVSPRGDLVAAWTARRGRRHHVTVSYRRAGEPALAPAERVSSDVPPHTRPLVRTSESGEAVVLWTDRKGARASVLARGGSSFGPARTVLPRAPGAVAAMGPDGTTLVVGTGYDAGASAAWRAPGRRTWSAPAAAPAAIADGPFDVALGPEGRALALRYDIVYEAARGEPLAETARGIGAGAGAPLAVAVGAEGAALLLTGGEQASLVRRTDAGAPFGAPRVVGAGPGPLLSEDVVALPDGGALALWSRMDPSASLYAAWAGVEGG